MRKGIGPLGLSVVGGSDHASHPFGVEEPGVFVSKVRSLRLLYGWKTLRARNCIYIPHAPGKSREMIW